MSYRQHATTPHAKATSSALAMPAVRLASTMTVLLSVKKILQILEEEKNAF